LFGSVGGSFRKVAAEVIASIAQMAVVQALFELAQGLAMLALTWFTGNPKYAKSAGDHFASAAMFGLIAGVAVPLGRVTAGDSFKNETAGGAGGGSGGGSAQGQGNKPGLLFTEHFGGFQQRTNEAIQRMTVVMGGVVEAVDNFTQKFGPVTPGHVVMAGAGDAQAAVFGAVQDHMGSDLRASANFDRAQGRMR
jgi:hypothetical protein